MVRWAQDGENDLTGKETNSKEGETKCSASGPTDFGEAGGGGTTAITGRYEAGNPPPLGKEVFGGKTQDLKVPFFRNRGLQGL